MHRMMDHPKVIPDRSRVHQDVTENRDLKYDMTYQIANSLIYKASVVAKTNNSAFLKVIEQADISQHTGIINVKVQAVNHIPKSMF